MCVHDRIDVKKPKRHALGSSAKALCLVHGETFASGYVPPRPFRVNAGPVHAYVLMAGEGGTKYLSEVRAGDQVLVVQADGSARAATVGRCKVEPRPMLLVSFQAEGDSEWGAKGDKEGADGTQRDEGQGSNGAGNDAENVTQAVGGAPPKGQLFLQQAETVRLMSPTVSGVGSSTGAVGAAGSGTRLEQPLPGGSDGSGNQGVAWRPISVTSLKKGDCLLVSFMGQGTHVGQRISASVTER
eukprot:jgi/Mesvir1/12078/Mv00358-RA.1